MGVRQSNAAAWLVDAMIRVTIKGKAEV